MNRTVPGSPDVTFLFILTYSVIDDSGQVSLEHLLLWWSIPEAINAATASTDLWRKGSARALETHIGDYIS